MSRAGWVLVLFLAAPGALAAQAEPDRHAARREWLARRRAGELPDSSAGPVAPAATRGAPAAGTAAAAPPAEARAPHRFAERFRPNAAAGADVPVHWPMQPLWPAPWRASPGAWWGAGVWGAPWNGGAAQPWGQAGGAWWQSGHICVRVTLTVLAGGRHSLYLFLPPAGPWDAAELELLLDRQLAAGQALQLQTADGTWVRVQPGARLESLAVGGCGS